GRARDAAVRPIGRRGRVRGRPEDHLRAHRPLSGSAVVILLALALDAAVGDPPNVLHPVAGMGALLRAGQRRFARGSRLGLRVAGALLVVGAAAGLAGYLISALAATLGPFGLVIDAIALELMFAVRGLARAVLTVAGDLEAGDIGAARAAVATDLVSRPTSRLDVSGVA